MPLGYGYVEREASDYVDWSKISSDLSKTLLEEKKRREDIKDALEEQLRKDMKFLAEPPQGESVSGNEYTQKFSSDASQFMLMMNRKLKSGEIDPRDYKIVTQNLMDGTDEMYNASKLFQENYKESMDRYKNGDSQKFELWSRAQIEGFADFANTQGYIDPMSGRVKVAKKVKKIVDGKEVFVMSENPDDVTSSSILMRQAAAKYNKFDTNSALDQYAKSLGQEIDAVRSIGGTSKSGQVLSLKDITSRTYTDPKTKEIIYNFMEAETNAINALLANPYNRMSVLTEDVKFIDNKEVDYTTDIEKAKANKNLILMKVDPKSKDLVPDFENSPHGKEQLEKATEWLRDQARSRYDRVKGIETYQESRPDRTSQWEYEAAQGNKQKRDNAGLWNQLYWGDAQQKKAAAEALIGTPEAFKMGLTKIDTESTPGKINLVYANPALNTSKTYANVVDGALVPVSRESWAQTGSEIHQLPSKEAANIGVSGAQGNFNPNFKGTSAQRQGEAAKRAGADYTKQINDYVNANVNVVEDNPQATVQSLKSKFPNFRFDASTRGVLRDDYVVVSIPGKAAKEFKIDDLSQQGALQQYLADNMDKTVSPGGGGKGELD